MQSTWLKDSKKRKYPRLEGKIETDILIIGGGISGIMLAYQFIKSNKKVILVEQNLLYHATTGYTTGKITFQHAYKYQKLIENYGKEVALKYYQGNKWACENIKKLVDELNIDCEYIVCSHYLFNKYQTETLKKEKNAYELLNISYIEHITDNAYCLEIPNQAVFHIVKFLDGILKEINNSKNISIYENSRVISVKDKELVAYGEDFTIIANKIVYASFYPQGKFFYFLKLKPVLSFVIEADLNKSILNSGIDAEEPLFSYRPLENGKGLFAGFSKDSNQFPSFVSFSELKKKAENYFSIKKMNLKWINQDYDPLDELPIIGKIKENIYIMTGYNKWGISTSVLASKIIYDLIENNVSEYKDIFSPKRKRKIDKKIKYFVQTPLTFIQTYLKKHTKQCTHLHCALHYNPIDNTYDCPCHGSRFDENGKVIIGPAKKDLR